MTWNTDMSAAPGLEKALRRAAQHKMTPAERFEQKVSFVYGQMNGNMTREQVRAAMIEGLPWPAPANPPEGEDA